MKIRVEFEEQKELDKVLSDLNKLYAVKYVSKIYYNRPPSVMKRVYVEFNFKDLDKA